jgi:hypothetical protein
MHTVQYSCAFTSMVSGGGAGGGGNIDLNLRDY